MLKQGARARIRGRTDSSGGFAGKMKVHGALARGEAGSTATGDAMIHPAVAAGMVIRA